MSEAATTIVREIPATIGRLAAKQAKEVQIKRVAAYARVSTETEEQQNSYEAQVNYYTQYIQGKKEWAFAGVYSDEGISGTSTRKRDGFNRMIRDALDGKIDLIITKSVSRFARNTVDTLSTVRKLKECGVEVFFEKENIYTMDSKGELLITIMSSLAQEESRSISENVTWGQRKRFADGKVSMPYKQFLGYEKGEDGKPCIVPEQAKIIKMIYRLFVEGMMPSTIATHLTQQGIPTPAGKKKWQCTTVESILTNEKYKGDAILQKSFCVDFLTKKMKLNEGEVPKYYVENSHPAIIEPAAFDEVQVELARRRQAKYNGKGGCFSSRIICGECGSYFGKKVWHSTDEYRRVIWQCNHKYKGDCVCQTPHVDEEDIKRAFVEAINQMITSKDTIIKQYRAIIKALTDTSALEQEHAKQQNEYDVVEGLIRRLISENAQVGLDPDEYARRETELLARYDAEKAAMTDIETQIQECKTRRTKLATFIRALEKQDGLIAEFDVRLWNVTVESVTVYEKNMMEFAFRGAI
ncbi:MAG: recombinase family protein [Eubacteriales bacterium]|nr:recombinase family protein [Eubacteriales bacterium]